MNFQPKLSLPFGRQMPNKHMFKQHQFDKRIVQQVSKYLKGDNYHGILQVCEDWFVIGLFIWLTLYIYDKTHYSILSGVAYFICIIAIGGRHRSLADILHQSSHGCLAENKTLNYILGTYFSGYTIFQSYSVYVGSHVRLHHTYLGNPNKDPDYIGIIENKICGKYRSSQRTAHYIASIVSPMNSIGYIKYVLTNRIYNKTENPNETLIRGIYWLVVLFIFHKFGWLNYFILFWIVPFVTSNVWIGSILELLEHFPMIDNPSIEYIDIFLTKNRVWSCITNFFIGM